MPQVTNHQRQLRLAIVEHQTAGLQLIVHMRRLPADRMLDYAIRHDTVDEDEVRRAALRLADFYDKSPPIAMTPVEYRQRFDADIRADLLDLTQPRYGMPVELCERIATASAASMRSR